MSPSRGPGVGCTRALRTVRVAGEPRGNTEPLGESQPQSARDTGRRRVAFLPHRNDRCCVRTSYPTTTRSCYAHGSPRNARPCGEKRANGGIPSSYFEFSELYGPLKVREFTQTNRSDFIPRTEILGGRRRSLKN